METSRLSIRKFADGDAGDLYEYLSLTDVVFYEPYGTLTQQECVEEAKCRVTSDEFWAVCMKENGKLIGNLYFAQTQPKAFATWEIGYVFNPTFGGKGYATEACRRLLQYGFEELEARRITAGCCVQNNRSWKLLERLGMRREAHEKQAIFFKKTPEGEPIWWDTYHYGMLREEWQRGV